MSWVQYGCLSLVHNYVQVGDWSQGQRPLRVYRFRTVEASILFVAQL